MGKTAVEIAEFLAEVLTEEEKKAVVHAKKKTKRNVVKLGGSRNTGLPSALDRALGGASPRQSKRAKAKLEPLAGVACYDAPRPAMGPGPPMMPPPAHAPPAHAHLLLRHRARRPPDRHAAARPR